MQVAMRTVPSRREIGEIPLRDGRMMSFGSFGAPDGVPVLIFHGTPGSHFVGEMLHDAAVQRGVRLIAPDRPGIGCSTFQKDRTLLDWPNDVADLAEALDLEALRIIGYSGGGPYALACAARLRDRVAAVAVVSGSAPLDRPGVLNGSSVVDRLLIASSLHAMPVARLTAACMVGAARWFPGLAVRVGEPAMTELEHHAMEPLLDRKPRDVVASFVESMRQGANGVAVDYRVTSAPWGFLPEEIESPTTFWHGIEDDIVPIHQAQGLASRIAGSRLFEVPETSHLLLRVCAGEILADLLVDHVGRT